MDEPLVGLGKLSLILRPREDGGVHITSPDVPGLYLSGREPDRIWAMVADSVVRLMKANRGMEIELPGVEGSKMPPLGEVRFNYLTRGKVEPQGYTTMLRSQVNGPRTPAVQDLITRTDETQAVATLAPANDSSELDIEMVEEISSRGRALGVWLVAYPVEQVEALTALARDMEANARGRTEAPAGTTFVFPEHGCTCFHCGETFHTVRGARAHFGATPTTPPLCLIRWRNITEAELRRELKAEVGYISMERLIEALNATGRRRSAENLDALTLLGVVRQAARQIDNGRTLRDVFEHGKGEMVELGAEIAAAETGAAGGADGILGEAVDVIQCMMDLILEHRPDVTDYELLDIMEKKCRKWVRHYSHSITKAPAPEST